MTDDTPYAPPERIHPDAELPYDLRTPDGVEQFAKRWHAGLEGALNRDAGSAASDFIVVAQQALVPMAYVMVTRSPDTGERLECPKLVRMTCASEGGVVSEQQFGEAVRALALRYRACGVAVALPVLVAESISHEHGLVGLDPNLRVIFCVDHMSEHVGRRMWTATLKKDDTWHVGEFVEEHAGYQMSGALSDLLPQKKMQ